MESLKKLILESKECIIGNVIEEAEEMKTCGMITSERINAWLSTIAVQSEYYPLLVKERDHLNAIGESNVDGIEETQTAIIAESEEVLSGVTNLKIPFPNDLKKYLEYSLRIKRNPKDFDFLPKREEATFKVQMLSALSYVNQEIRGLEKFFQEESILEDENFKQELHSLLEYHKGVLNSLKMYMQPEEKKATISSNEEQVEEVKRRNIVFLRRANRTYFEDDIEDMKGQSYQIKKCLCDFVNGGPIYKNIVSEDKMKELRYDEVRILLEEWEEGYYIVIGAFLKKATSSKKYTEFIDNRSIAFHNQEQLLLREKQQNPLFKETEDKILDRVINTLDKDIEGKRLVKNGRGI